MMNLCAGFSLRSIPIYNAQAIVAPDGIAGACFTRRRGRKPMVLTIISFVVVLGVLVFFHELGHYWVARRSGIVVEEFGMGYPPRVLKLFTYDGTDFTLNLLPFGGFARMKGEDAGDMSPGSFNSASIRGRAATLFAGPMMNFILAVILFAASFVAGFPAAAGHPQLTAVLPGSAWAGLGLQEGDILMSYGGAPVQVSVQQGVEATIRHNAADPAAAGVLLVSRGGELVELELADGGQLQAALETGHYVPVLMTQITGVAEESPALAAGMQAGDVVLDVDGTVITYANPLDQEIQQRLGQPVAMTLWRDSQWVDVTVTPRANPPAGQGAMGVQIAGVTEMASMGVLPALWEGLRSTTDYALLVLQLPFLLLRGTLSPADAQITGPVGIAQMVGGAVSATIDTGLWFPILRLSAVLSAALAITNLLPLPALDGGRLLFILIEAIRGRRVSPEREGMIHMVGFMLLLGLMLFITVRDLSAAPQGIDWIKLMGQ
jgi:regulator of sigma E protease